LTGDRQRVDKWLWHARVVRTRVAAAALAEAGCVRINGQRIEASSRPVRSGDVVTIALDRQVRVMRVLGFAERRGPPEGARLLYEDLSAPTLAAPGLQPALAARRPGTGRPTKQERRAIDQLLRGDGD